MSSAFRFSLDQSKILSSADGLKHCIISDFSVGGTIKQGLVNAKMSKTEGVCFEHHIITPEKAVCENGYESTQTLTNGRGSCETSSSPELPITNLENDHCGTTYHEQSDNGADVTILRSKQNGNHTVTMSHTNHDASVTTDMASENNASTSSDSCESTQYSSPEVTDSGVQIASPHDGLTDANVTSIQAVHQTPVTIANQAMISSHMTITSNQMSESQMTFTSANSIQGQIPVVQGNIVAPSPPQPIPQFTSPQMDPRQPSLTVCPIHQQMVAPPAASNSPLHPSGTPPLSESNAPSPNQSSTNGNQGSHHQHVVHVHIQPGETLTVRYEDQLQRVQGKWIVVHLFFHLLTLNQSILNLVRSTLTCFKT